MRSTKFKQCACISEASAEAFQDAANAILAQLPNPEIIVDQTKPFTMYIFYTVRRDTPEDILELLEMLDADGGHAHCQDCPAFVPDTDRRKKSGRCKLRADIVSRDYRACEFYYMKRRDGKTRIVDELANVPYLISD